MIGCKLSRAVDLPCEVWKVGRNLLSTSAACYSTIGMALLDAEATAKLIKQVRKASNQAAAANYTNLNLDAMARQVEFYFSDSNLPKDKFLKEKIAADPHGCEGDLDASLMPIESCVNCIR